MKKQLYGALLAVAASMIYTCSVWAADTSITVPKAEIFKIPMIRNGASFTPLTLLQKAEDNLREAGSYKINSDAEIFQKISSEKEFYLTTKTNIKTQVCVKSEQEVYTVTETNVEAPFLQTKTDVSHTYIKGSNIYNLNNASGKWEQAETSIADTMKRVWDQSHLSYYSASAIDKFNKYGLYQYGENVKIEGEECYTVKCKVDQNTFRLISQEVFTYLDSKNAVTMEELGYSKQNIEQMEIELECVFYIQASTLMIKKYEQTVKLKFPIQEEDWSFEVELEMNSGQFNYNIGNPTEFTGIIQLPALH